ncbi:ATP-dependent DNA helicase RecQ-like [Ruditapes philippinarum]|uniref:ATP-dependent DNA helicase RecQ-like n=1 Tax=Ruditapes philippinarum TaxID=129788 RepID=UPI00295AE840|nr:ATP-dependent DNA helicase RecQ-like [Ruditapes philippinarum]
MAESRNDKVNILHRMKKSFIIMSELASAPYEYIFKRVLDDLVDLGDQFPVTVIYCKAMQWIGYGYQLAREILGDKFYAGEPSPETARVVMFHSSMEGKMTLANLQKSPDQCSLRLVFASVALGMGADLRHVERVIHTGPPSTLETYIQEVGRCGQTGTRVHAILYYNNSDLANQHMQASMKDFCV